MALRTFRSNAWLSRRRRAMLEAAEQTVEAATGAAIRQFLRRARAEVTEDSLTAAASDFRRSLRLFELGEARGWWTDALNEHVTDAVRTVWRTGYFDTRDGELVASSLQAAEDYMANVVDRLSRTATPTIPEQAFDRVRVALSDEMARGAPIRDMSQRLAAELDWDQPARYWRGRLSELDGQVDRILDPLGPPGSPAREAARANDPQVRELQRLRAEARQQVDRVQSTWETRAERIARTETTGAWSSASHEAYHDEGVGVHVWFATGDDRTRDTHLDAHGQCRPLDQPFDIGGDPLMFPGDPSGPPEEIINCRCATVGAADCDEAQRDYSFADEPIDEERERRDADDADGA